MTSSGGASLMKDRLICHTTKAMITNAITALRKAPQRIATSVAGSPPTAGLSTILSDAKSTQPMA